MKLLLDENLPHDLRNYLAGHEAYTVAYMGWSAFENGELLAKAASENFDALLTKDQGIEHEQNLANLPLSVVILRAKSNKLDDIVPLVPALLNALRSMSPKSVVRV